jgi:hypothetical protein
MRQSGRTIPLSLPRRIIGDLMYFAQRVPTVPVQRLMNLSTLVQTRRRLAHRPSWVILFTKAYAMVCEQIPELRRSYLAWPSARLYEHAQTIASVAIQRQYEGEPSVWFARLREPHRQPIVELERLLRQQRELPLTQIKHMRRLLHVARWWQPLRRLGWAVALNCSGVLARAVLRHVWRDRLLQARGRVAASAQPVDHDAQLRGDRRRFAGAGADHLRSSGDGRANGRAGTGSVGASLDHCDSS